MKVDSQRKVMELTRTNLMVLLAKLDGHPKNSACTIGGHPDADCWFVKAVEDEEHYIDRPRGEMHPATEAVVRGLHQPLSEEITDALPD